MIAKVVNFMVLGYTGKLFYSSDNLRPKICINPKIDQEEARAVLTCLGYWEVAFKNALHQAFIVVLLSQRAIVVIKNLTWKKPLERCHRLQNASLDSALIFWFDEIATLESYTDDRFF